MNNTEWETLSREKLLVLCEQQEERIEQLEQEISELESKIDELEGDIGSMVWPEDTCGCIASESC